MSDRSPVSGTRRWPTAVRAGVLGLALLVVLLGCVALVGMFVVALG